MEPGNTFSSRLQRSIQILFSGFQKNGKLLTTFILVLLNFTVSAKDISGPANKEYHHWANGGTQQPNPEWINGALQKTNSTYVEGDIVPHVYTPDTKNWSSGAKTITVYYDYANLGSSTVGGFFAFIDHFSPPDGFNGASFALAGDLYASSNISNVSVTILTNVSSGGQIYSRRKIDFTYTGGSGDPAAIYFGLQLAKQTDDPLFYDQGSAYWPGASLQTSLEGNGSRTLSINLNEPVTCTTIGATIEGGTSVCINGTEPTIIFTALNGTAPFTFEYTINGGPSQFVSTDPGESSVAITAPTGTAGDFEYELISVAGQFCENDADGSTTVTVNPKPTAKIEVSDAVCDGGTVTVTFTGLVGTAPFLFAYTIDGAQQTPIYSNSSGVATIDITDVGSHTYALTGVDDANCSNDATGSVTATVNPKPTAKIEVSDPACDGSSVTVTFTGSNGTAPYFFSYSIDGTPQLLPIQSNAAGIATITVSTVGSHIYDLTGVSDANCSNTATGSVTATIYEKPTASMEIGSSSVCKDDLLEITFTGSGGTKPYTFHYTDPDGNAQEVSTTGTNSTVKITVPTSTPGSYSYSLTSVNDAHCSNTANGTVSAEVKPLPNVNFNFTGTCAATPIQLTADVTVNQLIAAPYQWFVNGSAAGTNATLTIVNGVAGTTKTVKLTVTGLNGCTNSITKIVSAIACSQNTLTQGFYGNTNGKACPDNATAVTILTNWLSSQRVIGNSTSLTVLTNGYNTTGKGNFTINVGEASTLNGIMPGGQTPNRINTTSSSISYTTGTIPKNSGKISNVLITQTITMSVNLMRSSGLGNIIIEPAKYATVVKSSTKCAIPTSCSGGTITSSSMSGVSSAFATYINGKNITFLYNLANDALGGGVLPTGVSYGDINIAVDFYNKLFDGGVLFLGNFDTKQTSCGGAQPRGTTPDYVQVEVVKPVTVKGLGVSAYPNPFTDKVRFTIQTQKSGKAILEVYNTLGQRVGVAFEGQLSAGETRVVDFNASSTGQSNLYYILRMNDDQVTGKIMHAGSR